MTEQKSARGSSRDAKRSRFQEEEKTTDKSKRWMVFSAIGLIVVAGATFGMISMLGGGGVDETPLSTSTSSTSSAASTSLAATSVSYTAATNGHEPYPLVEADDSGAIRLPVETFDDYVAHYYTYVDNDQSIEFFVLKSEDGVVRAAFNACDVCYGALQGYSQDGQIMVCNNCGRQFPADRINIVQGGCNPSPLDRNVEGNYLVLNADDIIRGASYF
ncbi:Fe-S-containing protein [Candidatus Bipolaricaulota bacterium]